MPCRGAGKCFSHEAGSVRHPEHHSPPSRRILLDQHAVRNSTCRNFPSLSLPRTRVFFSFSYFFRVISSTRANLSVANLASSMGPPRCLQVHLSHFQPHIDLVQTLFDKREAFLDTPIIFIREMSPAPAAFFVVKVASPTGPPRRSQVNLSHFSRVYLLRTEALRSARDLP